MPKACFISDLHLDVSTTRLNQAFIEFLRNPPQPIDILYILGDLFEAWIGDDATDYLQDTLRALTDFTQNTPCYFIHGNRDFLIGETFSQRTGVQLLDSIQLIKSGDKNVLLMHGDELCIDDHDYQQFRNLVRNANWQDDFLAKPIAERIDIAKQLRQASKNSSQEKSEYLMDVNQEEVESQMQQWQADILIHGHTHRPGIHQHLNGKRLVLGDWNESFYYVLLEDGKAELIKQAIG